MYMYEAHAHICKGQQKRKVRLRFFQQSAMQRDRYSYNHHHIRLEGKFIDKTFGQIKVVQDDQADLLFKGLLFRLPNGAGWTDYDDRLFDAMVSKIYNNLQSKNKINCSPVYESCLISKNSL